MQILLEFQTNELNLPMSYNPMLQGFIYRVLKNADTGFSTLLHNLGQAQSVNLPKLFHFGRLEGAYRTKGIEIIFPEQAFLEIRSPDEQFIRQFTMGCFPGECYPMGHNTVTLKAITVSDKSLSGGAVHVACQSPFAVHTTFENRNVFEPEVIKEKLIKNALTKWTQFYGTQDGFCLDIAWLPTKPKPVHSVFKGIFIPAWETDFMLYGNEKTVNFVYNTGIGAKNSQGYGMLRLV